MGKKIALGLSGGVDSAAAAILLKKAGWQPVGVYLKLGHGSSRSARGICKKLGIPFCEYDVSGDFKKEVIGYFLSELRKARTPNPCAMCNRRLKFLKLFEFAKKKGIDYVATGHYAKIRNGELLMPKDLKKDQTYGLCFLKKEWLKKIVFPLGNYTKGEVYKIAKGLGIMKSEESQDLCFADNVPEYIEDNLGRKPGLIKDGEGRTLGRHEGLHFYTIGQKKGLNLPGSYYVKEFDVKNNQLIVTKNKNEISRKEIVLYPFNLLSAVRAKERVMAKVRYRQELSSATLQKGKKLKVVFNKPQYSVTPGQFCVFYKGNVCLGGGAIC
ncbi:tRNA 2-thiouridine(34) synthase MnmA [Candidatus Woesearchaeota archaeon]|nr:tRNA 2-thiouridine(34) synthase MnmA [Candidatus Woesearchaeota archaeon]